MERKQYLCGLVCTIAIHKFQVHSRRSKVQMIEFPVQHLVAILN